MYLKQNTTKGSWSSEKGTPPSRTVLAISRQTRPQHNTSAHFLSVLATADPARPRPDPNLPKHEHRPAVPRLEPNRDHGPLATPEPAQRALERRIARSHPVHARVPRVAEGVGDVGQQELSGRADGGWRGRGIGR